MACDQTAEGDKRNHPRGKRESRLLGHQPDFFVAQLARLPTPLLGRFTCAEYRPAENSPWLLPDRFRRAHALPGGPVGQDDALHGRKPIGSITAGILD